MLDFTAYLEPFLLGLSSGVFCVTTCLPFMGPVMAFENRPARRNLGIFFQFMSGRFFGYILFGALFGSLGKGIGAKTAEAIGASCLAVLSVLLILYAAGWIKEKKESCGGIFGTGRTLFLIGFLTGVNVCPPFLMALSAVLTLQSVAGGIIFFIIFFFGTSIYFLPMLFLGPLAKWNKLRIVSRAVGLTTGCFFLYFSVVRIIKL
jgi:sulfite exporter TauE/SafE